MLFEKAIAKRCRLHKLIRQRFALAIKIQQEDFALIISADEATVIQSQRKYIQSQEDKSIIVEEDSSAAFDQPDASNSSIQSKSLFESAVATQPVASFAYSVDLVPRRKELKKEQSAAVVVINQQRSS
ncbi:hypothetical protein F511_18821 [Dorcoceras hygrometricum]|uniref:Uncharacterized protein n=1 Tax=Dorcoceras hygrometricum TaxID=472368 RepID=A0A2Z7BEJ1_9LAMI|nr:hypothetical protein F511_18821 [Dorcoceras hygrometricum]